jgi:hypothetical protein
MIRRIKVGERNAKSDENIDMPALKNCGEVSVEGFKFY